MNTNKNDKNDKNDKNIEAQQKELALELQMYLDEYPKEMLREFWEYWSEPNKSKTKIKKELQKTWETKRRLKTWERNNQHWRTGGTNKSIFETNEFRSRASAIAESIFNDPDLK